MGMEQQAAAVLGEGVRLVATVSSKGTAKRIITAGVARQLGGAAGHAAAQTLGNRGSIDSIEGHKGYMVLALTGTSLGVFKQKAGLLKPSCGEILGTIPMTDVSSFSVGGGALTAALTVTLSDGTELEFEVPRVHKGKVEKIRDAIGRSD
ncbi:MAG: hypothetical protein ABI577_12930 [bacterium]